jgi:argininosuccinate lyase
VQSYVRGQVEGVFQIHVGVRKDELMSGRLLSRGKAGLLILVVAVCATAQQPVRDINTPPEKWIRAADFLDQINKASVVMLDETGLLPHPMAATIAKGIEQVLAEDRKPGSDRARGYLEYEPKLIAAIGPDASRLHIGRSRQDMGATISRMTLRETLLDVYAALTDGRDKLLTLADKHTRTIIPGYTHGVQAQPITFAHYLVAYAEAFDRDSERMQQAYRRVNQSPLGAAALATSGFAVDRKRLAASLGFDGIIENADDANHLSPVDSAGEVANAITLAELRLGEFSQDMQTQYANPVPWFTLTDSRLTGISSIMPQKRNPSALERLRWDATMVIGEMHAVVLMGHNNRTGAGDVRLFDPVPSTRAIATFKLFGDVVNGISVNQERALAEVNADYSTTTEIADMLFRAANVPFRIGHHFASNLTDYGRAHGLKLGEIPYAEAARIYKADTKQDFPLTPAQFKEAISAEYMVYSRKGVGGPQLDRAWLKAQRDQLASAEAALDKAVANLASQAGNTSNSAAAAK